MQLRDICMDQRNCDPSIHTNFLEIKILELIAVRQATYIKFRRDGDSTPGPCDCAALALPTELSCRLGAGQVQVYPRPYELRNFKFSLSKKSLLTLFKNYFKSCLNFVMCGERLENVTWL